MAEGSRNAVPETVAEVGCGVAVLEARSGGGGVLRETVENLRVVRAASLLTAGT